MKRINIVVALIVAIGVLVGSCSQQAAPTTPSVTKAPPATTPITVVPTATAAPADTPQYGGVLRVRANISPRMLSPWPNTTDGTYLRPPYETLLRVDEKGALQPWLATDWKFSQDYKSLTLTLRNGVKFHDGTDLNAAAAKWNIEMRKAAKVGDYEQLTSIDIVDDYTIRLNLTAFTNTLLISMWYVGGMMASPTAYQKYGPDQSQWNPVGTGAYKFVSYDKDALLKFERFDGYWQKGKPYLDRYHVVLISDPMTASAAFQRGEVDVLGSTEAKDASELRDKGFNILGGGQLPLWVLAPDSKNPDSPFAKKSVREAVEYAIDKEGILKAVGYGLIKPVNQLSEPTVYAYVPDLKGRTYDAAKAKQLLADAGYPNGFKAPIYCRTGTSAMQFLVAAATNLKAVGIDATVEPVDIGRYTTLTQGGWRNSLMATTVWNAPDWLSRQYTALSTTSADYASVLKPSGLQDLFQQALTARDFAAQKAACQQAVKLIFDEALLIPCAANALPVLYQKNVHNAAYYMGWGPGNTVWSPREIWLSK